MPRAEYSKSMIRMRKATIDKLYELADRIETDNTAHHGEQYAQQLRTLLDLYFGTVPPTYRGESNTKETV